MFKTAGAAAFFAAWQGLCQTTIVPHYRDAFQQLPAEMLPCLLVIEVAANEQYIIRFMGTARVEMWGVDLTGKDSLDIMPPNVAAAARRNLRTMLDHPCGLYHVAQNATSSGREMYMENITVPAANDPELPRRVVNFSEEISTIAYGPPAGQVRSVSDREWVDIGAGLPKKPPAR